MFLDYYVVHFHFGNQSQWDLQLDCQSRLLMKKVQNLDSDYC